MKTISREGVEFLPIESDHFSVWLDRIYSVYFQSINTLYNNQRIHVYTSWIDNWRSENRLDHQSIAKVINDTMPKPELTDFEKSIKL